MKVWKRILILSALMGMPQIVWGQMCEDLFRKENKQNLQGESAIEKIIKNAEWDASSYKWLEKVGAFEKPSEKEILGSLLKFLSDPKHF